MTARPDQPGDHARDPASRRAQRPGTRTDAQRRADVLINRILDAESDGELHLARGLQAHGEEVFPDFSRRIEQTRDALGRLTVLPDCPDFARAIISKAESVNALGSRDAARQAQTDDALFAGAELHSSPVEATEHDQADPEEWEPSFGKRESEFSTTRLAMAAGMVGAAAFALVLSQFSRPVSPSSGTLGPVSEVVSASRADLVDSGRSLAGAILSLGDGLLAPVPAVPPLRDRRLTLGDASKYETSLRPSTLGTPLASGPTSLLAIVDGPVNPSMRLWNIDDIGRPLVGSLATAFAQPLSTDQLPHIRAWKLLRPSPEIGGIPGAFGTRKDFSWAELEWRLRDQPGVTGDASVTPIPK